MMSVSTSLAQKMNIVLLASILVCLFTSVSLPGWIFAQESQQNEVSTRESSSFNTKRKVITDKVGNNLTNPLAPIWSIGLRNDFTFLSGDPSVKSQNSYTLNIQPVIPIPIRDNWFLVIRSVLPIIGSTPVVQEGVGIKGRTGFGDMILVTALSPRKSSGFKWALGTTWIFPTATKQSLGGQKW